jgi:hypothetical protein
MAAAVASSAGKNDSIDIRGAMPYDCVRISTKAHRALRYTTREWTSVTV